MAGNRTYAAVVGRRESPRAEAWGVSAILRRRPRVKPPGSVRGGKLGAQRRASDRRLRRS